MNSTEGKKENSQGALWILIGVGTQLSASVISGFVLGFGTDVLFDTKPIFMMAFGMLGFVGGLIRAYQLLSKVG
ncbi:MAG: AtpZ/AtpI family protein [Methylophagaceae bacterium]